MVLADFMNAKGEMQLLWLTATDCNHLKKQKHAGGTLNTCLFSTAQCVLYWSCQGKDKYVMQIEPIYVKHKPQVFIF